jgi:hypothetical protein
MEQPTQKYVTIDWLGYPITTDGDGYILPRIAEMIINKRYYPTGVRGEWPCDPATNERLPMEPRVGNKAKVKN